MTSIDQLDKQYPADMITQSYEQGKRRIQKEMDAFVKRNQKNENILLARWQDVKDLVYHLDGRIHYWDDRRTQYLQLVTAILGASLAGILAITNIAVSSTDIPHQLILFSFILVPLIVLVIGSINIIRIWNRQNNPPYPFTKSYKGWRWQYRHAEKEPINTDTASYTGDSFKREVDKYSENLYTYKSTYLNASINDLLDQDLSQLYLCIINEKFKIKFISELRDSFYSMLQLALWSSIVFIILSIVYFYITMLFI